MAQTKTRTQTKPKSRSGSTKAKTKSQGNSRKTSAARSTKARSSSQRGGGSQAKRRRSSQGARRSATRTNDRGLMDRAKGPATAAGMALLGAAGMAAASRGSKRNGFLSGARGRSLRLPTPKQSNLGKALKRPSMPRPDLKKAKKALKGMDLPKADEAIDWVEEKAKGVGDAGYRVADMTSQARTVKKAVSGK